MRRFKHRLSHYRLSTFDLGQLIPVGLVEVVRGDSFQHGTTALIRLSPMAAPVMHPITVRLHHFFVPHRLVWSKAGGTGTYEDFITSGPDGDDSQTVPTIEAPASSGTILDYMGIPPEASGVPISALPLAGYNLIYNEYYRDQDLAAVRDDLDTTVPYVAWEKDYLTSARPWPQKGPDITLPVGTEAPVITRSSSGQAIGVYSEPEGEARLIAADQPNARVGAQSSDEENQLYADLSATSAVPINEFRKAFALQRYAEARARFGSRFTEFLRYHGINPSDARLDRPEYLAGSKSRMSISEILQTAPEGQAPARDYGVGDLFGHGVSGLRSPRYRRFFEEDGYVHTLMSIRPKAMYLQAISRHWLRKNRDDFFQKELQHIGQQAISQNEAYGNADSGDQVFGYVDRYRELREQNSLVSGEFRDILNYWHLGRDLQSPPTLNQSFTDCVPSKRIFNEQTQHSCWAKVQHSLVARRLLSKTAQGQIL